MTLIGWFLGIGFGAASYEIHKPIPKIVKTKPKRVPASQPALPKPREIVFDWPFTPIKPFTGERFGEGEISFVWNRTPGDRRGVILTIEKIENANIPVYSRFTRGSRRTKSLVEGKYRWSIHRPVDGMVKEWVYFEIFKNPTQIRKPSQEIQKAEEPPLTVPDSKPSEEGNQTLSPFIAWPRFHLEAGPLAAYSTFNSQLSRKVTSTNFTMNQGYQVRVQYSFGNKIFTEGYIEEAKGYLSDQSNFVENVVYTSEEFNSSRSGLGIRYRAGSDPLEGVGYFVGGGIERAHDFRFNYNAPSANLIVNRAMNMDLAKFVGGLEYRSYHTTRGRLELGYYSLLRTTSENTNATTQLSALNKAHFSIDSQLAHSLSEKLYLGMGVKYLYQQYDLTTNETGQSESGTIGITHFQTRLFFGLEL